MANCESQNVIAQILVFSVLQFLVGGWVVVLASMICKQILTCLAILLRFGSTWTFWWWTLLGKRIDASLDVFPTK